MSMIAEPLQEWPPPPNFVSATPTLQASANVDINGTGQWFAAVQQMPFTATIDRVFFSIGSATTGCTALVRIETIDTATGLPTGTLVHANASQSVSITSGAGEYEVTFPGTFSISRGTLFAIYVGHSSGSPSAIRANTFVDDNNGALFPFCLDYDTGATFRDNIALVMGLGISGGSAVPLRFVWPLTSATVETFQATSTPDTKGNRFTLDAPARIGGLWVWADLDSTATLKLYAADGATVLGSISLYESVPPSAFAGINRHFFSSAIDVPAGDVYAVIEATGGANIGLATATFYSAGWRDGSPMGGGKSVCVCCTQTPTGIGSWTVESTKQSFLGLLIEGHDDGTGSGGGGGGRRPRIQMP